MFGVLKPIKLKGEPIMIASDSVTPLYEQVADAILKKIEHGELRPGERIGSINDLMGEYGVSRVTAINAIDNLSRRGIVVSRQGKGTFIRDSMVGENLGILRSFKELTSSESSDNFFKVLYCDESKIPQEAAAKLETEDDKCLFIERLTSTKTNPIGLVKMWLPRDLSPIFVGHADKLEHLSVFEMLEQNSIVIRKSSQIISAIPAGKSQAEILQIKYGDPLLYIERTTYTAEGRPILYSCFYYRSDSYSFKIKLFRSSNGSESDY